jgi:hypothetical protein
MNATCRACGDTGMAIVPTMKCIWNKTVVFIPGTTSISTGAVICDRAGCTAGRKILDSPEIDGKPRQRRLGDAERLAGGVNLPELLREYEQFKAREARGNQDEATRHTEFAAAYPRLWDAMMKHSAEINGDVRDDVNAEESIPL